MSVAGATKHEVPALIVLFVAEGEGLVISGEGVGQRHAYGDASELELILQFFDVSCELIARSVELLRDGEDL